MTRVRRALLALPLALLAAAPAIAGDAAVGRSRGGQCSPTPQVERMIAMFESAKIVQVPCDRMVLTPADDTENLSGVAGSVTLLRTDGSRTLLLSGTWNEGTFAIASAAFGPGAETKANSGQCRLIGPPEDVFLMVTCNVVVTLPDGAGKQGAALAFQAPSR